MCEENGWTTFGIDISNHAIAEAKKSLKAELNLTFAQIPGKMSGK
jgi:hypothetical protein